MVEQLTSRLDDRAACASARDLDAIRSALTLVDIESLRTYEQPDDRRVAEIAVSLRRTQTLVNPVIVDPEFNLLIDGHHRVKAFEWLGLKSIPAYVVDYLSPAVDIRGWSRATTASASEVCWAFGLDEGEREGSCRVVAINSRHEEIAHRVFREPMRSALYLEHIALFISEMGHPMTLEPTITPKLADQIHSYLDPVVGKVEVLTAAEAGQLFPREVNRHLIDGRPIAMRIPLCSVTHPTSFDRCVDNIFEQASPTSMSPGVRHDGRLYEESITLFTSSRADR